MLQGFFHWLQSGPAVHVWALLLLLLAAALIGGVYAFQCFYRKRLIEDMPTSRIQSAAQGYVELEGSARLMDGPPIIAPLSGQHCVWYRFRVEEKRSRGNNRQWMTVQSGTSDELFLLVDGSGECVVDPENALVTAAYKRVWYGNSSKPGSSASSSRLSPFNRYRYTELRIHNDDPLHIIGLFRSVGGAGEHLDINEDTKELLIEWKRDSNRLLNRFDSNQDGAIDIAEWQQAREAAYREVLRRHRDEKVSMPTHMIEQTRDRRRPFIISAKHQSDFIAELGRRLALCSALATISALLFVYLLQLRLTA